MTERPKPSADADPTRQALTKVQIDAGQQGMAPISFLAFAKDEPCLCDVFLPVVDPASKAVTMRLICPQGQAFKAEVWDHFSRSGLRGVCVKNLDLPLIFDAMTTRAQEKIADSAVSCPEKAGILKEMASMSVRVMFAASERDAENTELACCLAQRTVGMLLKEDEVLRNLSQLLVSGRTLFDHSINVCLMSLVLGRRLGLDKGRLLCLGLGALMHDVGMARVPAEVLNKPGDLTAEERGLIQKHPRLGHQVLSLAKSMPYDALNVVLNHHERADGKGYPTGVSESSIPYLARLVKVVDAYDAMTSPRPYRAALAPTEAAVMLLNQAGPDLDHAMAVEFIRMHREAFR